MKITTKIILGIVLSICLILPVFGQPAQEKDVIFRAVEDEMARSLKDLKFSSFDKPYFLEYIVEDVDFLTIQATYGAIRSSNKNRTRTLFTQVRVGDYELDNAEEFSLKLPYPLPLDNDYDSLRRAVWFVTDTSYKQAINFFEAIKAAKRNETEDDEDENVPSFSKETPVVSIKQKQNVEIDKAKWENQVRTWSVMFRSLPKFQNSTFNFYIRQANRYLINSEGTRILKPEFLITVDVHATALTADNTSYEDYRHLFATDFDDLSIEKIDKEIKDFAVNLERFENAKAFKDTYIGPAIFTEGAAVQLFLQLLAPNLSGGDFSERIGRKVLPSFLTVIDDPTLTKYENFDLKGNYKLDEEGVTAKPLTLIENGILKTLLMTRSPIKEIQKSNGRARTSGVRGSEAQISNLLIKSTDGKSFDELKKLLIEECKKQGLSYGVIFRENSATVNSYGGGGSVLVYKIYVEDGREELFKEAGVEDLSIRELRNILAAGRDSFSHNLLVNSSYNGDGTPASIVAPSVVLEEIYLKRSKSSKEKPRLIEPPFSGQ